ncbi:UNVERIFIED_CONTAM: hypothetical protein FKN15_060165 [Acipenser sinensis]
MDARHKKILQSSRSMLVRELDPSQLYDGLISRGIFSQDMIDEIKKDIGFEVSPDEFEPAAGGIDDHTDATPMSPREELGKDSDEPDARASLPTPSDILVSYSTFPGYVSWRDTQAGSWYVETLDNVLEEFAGYEDLLTSLTMAEEIYSLNLPSYLIITLTLSSYLMPNPNPVLISHA